MSRALHYLATAHLVVAAVAVSAAAWLAIRGADVILSPGVEMLGAAATICRVAAIVYLIAVATSEFGIAQAIRRDTKTARVESWLFAGQLFLLLAVLLVIFRGPVARLYLVGLDHLLAAAFTVALLSITLVVAGFFLRRREHAQPLFVSRSAITWVAPWAIIAAELVLLVSLGYLESRPLPGSEEPAPPAIAAGPAQRATSR